MKTLAVTILRMLIISWIWMNVLIKILQLMAEGNIFQKYRICKTIRKNY